MADLRMRQAVRALLVTPDRSVLLCRFEFPTATVWAVPGGGLDPGESHLDALRRELVEEVGLVGVEPGPHVWNREHVVPFLDGRWDGQQERYYLLPTAAPFDPRPHLSWEQLRAERLHELRWWTSAEIRRATDDGTRFSPSRLGVLLDELIDGGAPAAPIDTGV